MQQIILGGDSLWLGRGAVKELGTLQAKRAFIVTGGSSMKRYGFLEQAEIALRSSGCEVCLYEGVPANPDTETVLAGVQAMREFQPDLVLAMGGGSPIDAAKVMTLFYEYPELTFAAAKEGNLPQKRQRTRLVVAPSVPATSPIRRSIRSKASPSIRWRPRRTRSTTTRRSSVCWPPLV